MTLSLFGFLGLKKRVGVMAAAAVGVLFAGVAFGLETSVPRATWAPPGNYESVLKGTVYAKQGDASIAEWSATFTKPADADAQKWMVAGEPFVFGYYGNQEGWNGERGVENNDHPEEFLATFLEAPENVRIRVLKRVQYVVPDADAGFASWDLEFRSYQEYDVTSGKWRGMTDVDAFAESAERAADPYMLWTGSVGGKVTEPADASGGNPPSGTWESNPNGYFVNSEGAYTIFTLQVEVKENLSTKVEGRLSLWRLTDEGELSEEEDGEAGGVDIVIDVSLAPTITVGAQSSTLTAGTAGSATFAVSLANWATNPAADAVTDAKSMLSSATGPSLPTTGVTYALSAITKGNETSAPFTGTATLTVTVTDAASAVTISDLKLTVGSTASAVFTLTVGAPAFVPVTGISGVADKGTVGTALNLSTGTTVNPSNATNKTIVWSVKTQGTTGATIGTSPTLNATAVGTVVVTATIVNGQTATTDYTRDFSIVIGPAKVAAANISGITKPVAGNAPASTGSPADGSHFRVKSVTWTPTPAGGEFAPNIDYTAGIELEASENYTFAGVAANTFTVGNIADADRVTNLAGSGAILWVNAEFPSSGALTGGETVDKITLGTDVDVANITGSYTYDGKAKDPGSANITVRTKAELTGNTGYQGKLLQFNKHYTYTLSNNTNAGNGTVTITAIAGSGCTGSVTKTFEIAKATVNGSNVGSFFDLADITAKLKLDGTAVVATGSAIYSAKPALKSGFSGAGAVTLYYEGMGTTVYAKNSTAPKEVGEYRVGFAVTGGSNIDEVPVGSAVPLGMFRIAYGDLRLSAVVWRDTSVVYSSTGVYTINGPSISSSTFGTRDTIVDVSVSWESGSGVLEKEKVNNKGASIQISAVGTGVVLVKAKVRTTTTGTVQKLESPEKEMKVTIGAKALAAKDVKEIATLSAGIVYEGKEKEKIHENFIVYDGTMPLANTVDYVVVSSADLVGAKSKYCDDGKCNMKNAGTAYFVVTGKENGNYSWKDTVSVKYTIKPAPLTVEIDAANGKTYDGTADVDTISVGTANASKGNIKVKFAGLQNGETLSNVVDYLIKDAKLDSKDVTASAKATATVSLVSESAMAKNYTLASGAVSTVIPTDAVKIRVPGNSGDTSTFAYAIPKEHYFNNVRRGIGSVTLKKEMTNVGSSLTVLYTYAGNDSTIKTPGAPTTLFSSDTTIAPLFVGRYAVKARIAGVGTAEGKNIQAGEYSLGEYEILEAPKPVIAQFEESSINIRRGRSVTLTVNATSPNSGTLSYNWFETNQATNTTKKVGSNSKDLLVNANTEGTYEYRVAVTNSKSGVQVPASDTSGIVTVTVLPPPVSLARSIVELSSDSVVYTGGANNGPASVTVTFFAVDAESGDTTFTPLAEGTDYTVSYTNARDVGTATLRITGIEDYTGSITKTFKIFKADLDQFDFVFKASGVYTGKALSADVKLIASKSGAGEVTVYYNGDTTVPVNRGNYDVVVSAEAGKNFNAAKDIYVGDYEIASPVVDEKSFTYSIPTGHKEGVEGTVYGIGAVTFKNADWKEYGELTVLYNGFEADADFEWVANTYTVSVLITGGKNFDADEINLGSYRITGEGDAVKGADRVVPKPVVTEEAAVAPVAKVAASFSVGPNVSRAGETVKFFSSKPVKSGTLFVFDASGNVVAKVSAKSGVGAIGSLLVKSEGTYAVKGALAGKDGTRVKVSTLFTVVR